MLHLNKANPRGYSLVEMLIVIAVIGILAVVVTVNLKKMSGKARDVKRFTDISTVRKALELYNFQYNDYPETDSFQVGHTLMVDNRRLIKFPSNPWGADGPCLPNTQYQYVKDSNTSYHISYCLGSEVQGYGPGNCIATISKPCN
jgi:prepilin-type N-terminal cleavage/methylation domain-containing protein